MTFRLSEKIIKTKMPALNGRFCEMAAVTPQKRQCEIGSYYPAGSSVKPPPRKAAGTLYASRRERCENISQTAE